MNYYIFTIGCAQNVYDGEKIAFVLDKLGHFPSSEADADLIIILSCSVRQKAIDQIHGKIGLWRKMKKPKKIIVTACILPADKEKLKTVVDEIIPDREIIDHLIKSYLDRADFNLSELNLFQPKNQKHAYVPISFGCNNFCTYCAVPLTRGREVSRNEKNILLEIKHLAKVNVREVTLLGQNVNSYGLSDWSPRDLRKNRDQQGQTWSKKHPSPFVQLVKRIEKVKKIKKIGFLSPNPQDMSDDLIDWMGTSKKFSRQLNLPVQAGNDEVLRRMNRRYSTKEYLELVEKIKGAVPDIWLSTDIIVGFCGETKEQFIDTVNLVKTIGFKKAFIGQYSPRPGTTSAKIYPDNVSQEEKKRRWEILNQLVNLGKNS